MLERLVEVLARGRQDWARRMGEFGASPLSLVALNALALWPVWSWYVRRVTDGSDEPWGLLALATVLVAVWARRYELRPQPSAALLLGAAALTVLSALAGLGMPALVRAILGVSALALAIAAVLDHARPMLALWGLLLLALPVASSLQFYIGYPLRAFTAWSSAGVLHAIGLAVTPAGASLHWEGETVLVDAPCSGVNMLWTGMFLTCLLSYLQRAASLRFSINVLVALVAVILGNVLRNVLLFVKEAQIALLPGWTHAATGLGMYFLVATMIAMFVRWRPNAR